jgi:hypothetical protein
MKHLLRKLVFFPLIFLAGICFARSRQIGGVMVSSTGVTQSFNIQQELDFIDGFNMQAVWSDGTPSAAAFIDGVKSTGTITINNGTALHGVGASGYITVLSTSHLQGCRIVIGPHVFTNGVEWSVGATTNATATSIAAAIDATALFVATNTGGFNVIYATVATAGTVGNSYAFTSNDSSITVSAALLSGGVAPATLSFSTWTLTEGVQWTAQADTTATALSLAAAINTTGIVVSTHNSSNIIIATNAAVGDDYTWTSSSPTAMTTAGFTVGQANAVSVADNTIYKANHGMTTGVCGLFATVTGTAPNPLTTATTYWAIRADDDYFKLATTSTGAYAGSAIDITATTAAGGGSFTFTPLSLTSGAHSFKWRASNDGSNWTDLSITSATITGASSYMWNFIDQYYRYIDFDYNVVNSSGSVNVNVYINGKKDQ